MRSEAQPDTIYLVHGEPASASALEETIEAELDGLAVQPRCLERVRLA